MKEELTNVIEKTFQNSLFNILELIDYSPPLYDSNWNKKFIKFNPSTRVPDKKKVNLNLMLKNQIHLN